MHPQRHGLQLKGCMEMVLSVLRDVEGATESFRKGTDEVILADRIVSCVQYRGRAAPILDGMFLDISVAVPVQSRPQIGRYRPFSLQPFRWDAL